MGLELRAHALWSASTYQFWCMHSLTIGLGNRWKTHRRMFHNQFQQSVAPIYWPLQLQEAHDLIRRLLESPQNLIDHLRQSVLCLSEN